MSGSLGDFDTGSIIYFKFTTYRPSTGAAFTLGGTPAISIYKDNSTTQSTSGVTLTADFDSVTGLNHVAIDTSADGTFYSAGSFFDVVITTGTVDSVSVVGSVVGRFTLRKTSALKPTTAGRTLDVTATGEAGIDWANIGGPTTVVNLSGTTVKTATDVETDTADIQTRLPAALVSGRIDASVGAMATDVITSTALAASAVTEIQTGLSTLDAAGIRTAVGLASANLDTQLDAIPTAAENADAVWDEAQADHVAVGSFGETATEIADILTDTADMQPKLGTPAGASMSADIAAVKVDTAAILVDTGTSGVLVATGAIGSTQFAAGAIDSAAIAADAIGSSELAATAAEEIADTILLRKLDRSGNGTDLSNERTVVNALRALRNKQSIAAGTLTVTKENDTDTAWTATISTTASDPISSIDPA